MSIVIVNEQCRHDLLTAMTATQTMTEMNITPPTTTSATMMIVVSKQQA